MKTIIQCFIAVMFNSYLLAQTNLVSNPNFKTQQIPNGWSELFKANDWSSASAGTPDLYAKGAKNNEVTIPANIQGMQEPADGDSYAGIIAYQSSSEIKRDGLSFSQVSTDGIYTEYMQGKLTEALVAGKEYAIEIKLSLSETSTYAINNIGAFFSESALNNTDNGYLKLEPQFLSKDVIKDNNWTTIKGKFKAKGNEKYVVIGSWSKDRTVEALKKGGTYRAYYYIGQVSVSSAAPSDTDNDGIIDELDKCPTVSGSKAFEGCPDTDGDGITDADDKCPTEKGSKSNNGCPDLKAKKNANPNADKDKDGILDVNDKCPDVKGAFEFEGCPDTDGDGISDSEDKCPNTPGIEANGGCPEIKKEVLEVFERALQGIQFETAKDVIKSTSFPILNEVVSILKENTTYNLEIDGHTDNSGNAKANQLLSQKRANAVKKYLITKGIKASRLFAAGFGQEQPVESNDTPEGKAKNRRVEFKVR